ncbi:hypothetical protein ABFS83_07G067800 [Erythranthe nasuta]
MGLCLSKSSMNSSWSTESDLKQSELVTAKVITSHPNSHGGVHSIPKGEAICRFCFDVYNARMFQTKCKCKFSMIHQSCAAEWTKKKGNNKCDVCEQVIENIPIIVSAGHLPPSTPTTINKQLNTASTTPTPKRFWSCCSL